MTELVHTCCASIWSKHWSLSSNTKAKSKCAQTFIVLKGCPTIAQATPPAVPAAHACHSYVRHQTSSSMIWRLKFGRRHKPIKSLAIDGDSSVILRFSQGSKNFVVTYQIFASVQCIARLACVHDKKLDQIISITAMYLVSWAPFRTCWLHC